MPWDRKKSMTQMAEGMTQVLSTVTPKVIPESITDNPDGSPVTIPQENSSTPIKNAPELRRIEEVEPTHTKLPLTIADIKAMDRQQVYRLMQDWENGKGTPYQQNLGTLARQYSVIKGYMDKDYNLTAQGRRYLGLTG